MEGNTERLYRPPLPAEVVRDLMASDSSDFQEYAYSLIQPNFVYSKFMSNDVRQLSSGHRELKSVLDTVVNNSNRFYSEKPALVYWMTDSENLVSWLVRGSRKPDIQSDIFDLISLLCKLNIQIIPVHVPREMAILRLADEGSKYRDTDDWSIDNQSFAMLQSIAGEQVTCDNFAYNSNARVAKFYGKIPSPGCSGINAFSMNWSKDYNWVCPPVKEIINVIRHIQSHNCKGILVVPNWPTSQF